MLRRLAAFLAIATIGSADALLAQRSYPSLAKRPIESRDRLGETVTAAPVEAASADPALVATVDGLQAQALAADTQFRAELDKGRTRVREAVGAAPSSESWVNAQMTISAVDAVRYDSVAALASLDTLYVEKQDNLDGARVAADIATIDPVRGRVLDIVYAQNDALDALRNSLSTPQ